MITRLLTLLAVLGLFSVAAFAENAAEIQHRMSKRLPALDDLKAKQVIGENNHGWVELRASASGADSVVAEENRDREQVYALIAQETGSTPDSVGKARAKQIAANSKPGVWLQDEQGRWYQKK